MAVCWRCCYRRQRCSAVLLLLFYVSSSLGLTVERGSFIWLAWVRGEPRISLHRCQRCSSLRCCFAHCYLGRALSLFFYPKSKCLIFCSFVLFWSGSSIVPCCKRRHFSNKTSRAHSIHLLNPNPTTNNMRTGLEAQRTQMSELMDRRREKSRAKQKIMWQHNLQQFVVIDFQLKIKRERESESERTRATAQLLLYGECKVTELMKENILIHE